MAMYQKIAVGLLLACVAFNLAAVNAVHIRSCSPLPAPLSRRFREPVLDRNSRHGRKCWIYITGKCTYGEMTYRRGFANCEDLFEPIPLALCDYATCPYSNVKQRCLRAVPIRVPQCVAHRSGENGTGRVPVAITVPVTCQCA